MLIQHKQKKSLKLNNSWEWKKNENKNISAGKYKQLNQIVFFYKPATLCGTAGGAITSHLAGTFFTVSEEKNVTKIWMHVMNFISSLWEKQEKRRFHFFSFFFFVSSLG